MAATTAVPADHHLTVGQLIDATPLGRILDTPVADVLAGLKIPPLPQLPQLPAAPGIPTLPALNFDVLLKPLTDLLSSFGTGSLSTAAIDPSKVLSVLSQVLESTLSMSSAALRALDGLWSGSAATSATAKTARTGVETTALAGQGTGISVDIGAAASIVAAGLATVQAIVVKTVGLLAGTLPLIATPVGQGMALGFIAAGLAEGITAVTATRTQLLGPTTHMAVNGAPVRISGAPAGTSGTSPFAVAANLLDAVGTPLTTVTGTLTQALGTTTAPTTTGTPGTTSTNKRDTGPTQTTDDDRTGTTPASTTPAGLAGGGGGSGGGGAGGPVTPPTPLTGRPTASPVATEPAAATTSSTPSRAVPTATAAMAPAAMAPVAASGIRANSVGGQPISDHLVSPAHGVQLVGAADPSTVPAVYGDADATDGSRIDPGSLDLSLVDIQLDFAETPLRL